MPHCTYCGGRIPDGKYDRFCPFCGKEINYSAPSSSPSAPVVRREVVVVRNEPAVVVHHSEPPPARVSFTCRTFVSNTEPPEPSPSRPTTTVYRQQTRTYSSAPSSHTNTSSFQRSSHYASPEVQQPHAIQGSAREFCPGCGQPTNSGGEKLVSKGKEWHRDCFLRNDSGTGTSRNLEAGQSSNGNENGSVRCGLATTTYLQQPSWAYAEQHKNRTGEGGQYRDGMFRRV